MSHIIISILAFIVALSILVAVHEFGHFWVARKLGVRVLRFSVGFGKPILRYKRPGDTTEYVVAAIPLGGYVKMLDENEVEVAASEKHLAFNNKPVMSRIAIVCAGPLFNILLAMVLYALVFIIGTTGYRPIVGEVERGSFADKAGFQLQDEILSLEGITTRTWQEVRLALLEMILEQDTVNFTVKTAQGDIKAREIYLGETKLLKDQGDIIAKLGLQNWRPAIEPIIDTVTEQGAAKRSGLQAGDKIIKANQKPINSWEEWVLIVRESPEKPIELEVLRNESLLSLIIVPDLKLQQDKETGFIGASVKPPENLYESLQVQVRYPLFTSLKKGIEKTWDMTLLTFRMIGQLILGNASPKNISGPITIAEYAGKSVSIDISYFIDFIAIISVSLAVLNILPIPLLDGGHLMYYIIEIIKGSPVSEQAQIIGQNIGIVLLGILMSIAFYNDISRLIG